MRNICNLVTSHVPLSGILYLLRKPIRASGMNASDYKQNPKPFKLKNH